MSHYSTHVGHWVRTTTSPVPITQFGLKEEDASGRDPESFATQLQRNASIFSFSVVA